MPLFTIITVTYNASAVLQETLDSVFGQTDADWEYILVDGGSKDGTMDIVNQSRDRFAEVVSEPDKGLYDAMNKGMALARGDFVLFLNAGDRLADESVLTEVRAAMGDAVDLVLVYGDFVVLSRRLSVYVSTRDAHQRLAHDFYFCHQAMFFARNSLQPYDLAYPVKADYDLSIRVLQGCREEQVRHLPRAIVLYALDGHSAANLKRNVGESIRLHRRYWGWGRVLLNLPRYLKRIVRSLKEGVMDR